MLKKIIYLIIFMSNQLPTNMYIWVKFLNDLLIDK